MSVLPRLRLYGALAGCIAGMPAVRADFVDDTVTELMAKRHIPGLSLAIIQDGKIVKAKGYGVIENGKPDPVTPDTLFQAGSISKPVTALGALALVEAGKLTLDEDVNGKLKSWHVPENKFTEKEKVTLRRLLSHSAGLTVHGFPGYATDEPMPSLVQVLNGEPPANTGAIRVDFVPGSQWRYSGGGYTIVQQLMIDVTGTPFPEYMRKTVLQPLGMTASSYDQPLSPARAALTATGHTGKSEPVKGRWHVYPEMAAAGLWTTASDLARFAIGVQQAMAGNATPVISAAMTKEMLTDQKQHDGLGLMLSGEDPNRRFDHSGRDEGFDADVIGYCNRGRGAVVMINSNDNSNATARIMSVIADVYGWPDYPRYVPPKAIEDKEPEVTAQIVTIFEKAQEGAYDPELYTPKLAGLIGQALKGRGVKQFKDFGKYQKIELVGRENKGTDRVYRYRMIFADETVIVNCAYEQDGKIAGLGFRVE